MSDATLGALGAVGAVTAVQTNPVHSFIPTQMSVDQVAYSQATDQRQSTFASWMTDQVGQLNQTMKIADQAATELASGKTENLHQIMVRMEEAKLAFQLALQVRNKVMEAYQEVLRMQV